MSLSARLLSAAGTAKTFALNFWPWLVGAAVVGMVLGGAGARIFYRGEALEAKLQLSKFETQLAAARAENLALADKVGQLVLEARDAHKNRIDAVAADVRELGRRVQLCATKSDVRISVTAEGAIEAVPDGQQRDLAEAVREFAEACARERDRDAADHNALIEWLERMRREAEP